MEAAEAGSQPTPSRASAALASKIWSSVTDSHSPLVKRIARKAFFQFTGSPMRMAEASVCGSVTGTISEAPVASIL